jgi:hypothetical protein
VSVVVLGGVVAAVTAPVASAQEWSPLQQSLEKRFPRIAIPARQRSPYDRPMLTVMFTTGAVGSYFGGKMQHVVCVEARTHPARFRAAAATRLITSKTDVTLSESDGGGVTAVLEAYRRGALFGCSKAGA